MAKEVRLPQLGQTMEEGTIVSCTVKPGDQVKRGDVLFEVETDKATLEMESPTDGYVKHILAEVGQTLLVGEPVLVIGEKDEEIPQSFIDTLKGKQAPPPAEAPIEQPAAPASEKPAAGAAPANKLTGNIIASPRAKMTAKQLGIDLATVVGTGPAGKITEQDVKKASTRKPPAPASPTPQIQLGQTIPVNRLQKITAQRMLQSKREIPCFYLTVKADVTDLVDLRNRLNKTSDVKLSYNDFLMRAVATGIARFTIMAGQLDGDTIKLANSIGIGLAIAVEDGLVAPIVKDVNKKNIYEIARYSKDLIERTRNNKLAPADLEGGCITVTNLGAFGIESFIPIVVPGQCSIMGVGQITDTCVPQEGNLLVRKLMSLTLSVDHKVANGAYAAEFLDFVRKQVEDISNFQ